jgi:2-oxoglutarate ferredoxin oxidoreductase subunit alpha
MADKRWKKSDGLSRELEGMSPVNIGGDPSSATALLCWGSSKGVCWELAGKKGLRYIQPVVLWPFPEKAFSSAMEGVEQFYAVETNETGQLATLVRRFGYTPTGKVLKYDGRPFMVDDLEAALNTVIS